MKYQIEKDGTISLTSTAHETDLLIKALQRDLSLRENRAYTPHSDETLSLIVTLTDALIESNHQKMKGIAETFPGVVEDFPPPVGLLHSLGNLLERPFSVADFEGAITASGEQFFLQEMEFDPERPSYPYNVRGMVLRNHVWLPARWNHHGVCRCPLLGKEQDSFDLVRLAPTDISGAQLTALAIGALAILIVASRINF